MNRYAFEKKITNLFPSQTLKDEISAMKHRFTDREILKIIDDYAPSFDEKLKLLEQAKSVLSDKQCAASAERLIKRHVKMYEEFIKTDNDYVFEVGIKTSPADCEEKYLSRTFDGVKTIIKSYLRHYKDVGATDNKLSRYTVTKRSVKIPSKPSEIDKNSESGNCVLGYKLKLLSVDYYPLTNGYHNNIPLNLPPFLKKYDLVTFIPEWERYYIDDGADGVELENKRKPVYGINRFEMNYDPEDDCACLMLLDSPYVKNRTVDTKDEQGYYPYYMHHDHIEYPKITKVALTDVPKEIYDDYIYTVEQLKILDNQE